MVDEHLKPKLVHPESPTPKVEDKPTEKEKPITDAADLSSLWIDTGHDDELTAAHIYTVPVGKPRDFFRVIADSGYRRKCEVYVHKTEGVVEEQTFLIDKPMQKLFDEANPCHLVVCVYRDNTVRLWPLKLPKEGEKDNGAWVSARSAARTAMKRWVKVVWKGGRYQTRDAQPGYAPDDLDLKALPSFDAIVRAAFGDHGIIRDREHPMAKVLLGMPAGTSDGDDDDADDLS